MKKGELVAVVGDVGSGKSSLLAAIMGQMNQTKGTKMKIYGNISYVPQEAWLLNVLLKENIVFAIFIKIVVLILSAFGISTMWEAVFADVGVSVIAIINALRILRVKNIK